MKVRRESRQNLRDTLDCQPMNTCSNWRERTEAEARSILGGEHFDWAVSQGFGYCKSRAHGWWMANDGEQSMAYQRAAAVAETSTAR